MLITERLKLRELDEGDAAFIFTLLNDAAFLEFIGDRGVRNEAQALGYIQRVREGKLKNGFSLWAVTMLEDGAPAGLCGLVRRDTLPHVDLGFAFLPQFRRQGLGRESTLAVLEEAKSLGVSPLLAICSPHNVGSRALLEQVGFRFERMTVLEGQTAETCVYVRP